MAHFQDIQLLRTTYLRGPSIWTYRPVLEVWLDLGVLEDYPSNLLPGFNERLTAWLPGLVEHHCGVGHRGGFLERLQEGTWCGHVLEHTIIELLNLAGMSAEFGQTRSVRQRGVYRMVFRCPEELVAKVALQQGHALVMAAINNLPFDVAAAVAAIEQAIEARYLGPSTASIVDAAAQRRIPFIRLNDGNLVQLGYGAAQRRIWSTETDKTSAIGLGISEDKDLAKQLLKAAGVPVPEWELVGSADEAWDEAQDIGLPVTVKPYNSNKGEGVGINLTTEAQVRSAYAAARAVTRHVMVERHIPGTVHRLLVVGGKLVAASRGEYPQGSANPRAAMATVDCTAQVHADTAYLAALAAPKWWGWTLPGSIWSASTLISPWPAKAVRFWKSMGAWAADGTCAPARACPSRWAKAIVQHLSSGGGQRPAGPRWPGRPLPVVGIVGTQHNAADRPHDRLAAAAGGKRTGVGLQPGQLPQWPPDPSGRPHALAGGAPVCGQSLGRSGGGANHGPFDLEEGLAYDPLPGRPGDRLGGWEGAGGPRCA